MAILATLYVCRSRAAALEDEIQKLKKKQHTMERTLYALAQRLEKCEHPPPMVSPPPRSSKPVAVPVTLPVTEEESWDEMDSISPSRATEPMVEDEGPVEDKTSESAIEQEISDVLASEIQQIESERQQ